MNLPLVLLLYLPLYATIVAVFIYAISGSWRRRAAEPAGPPSERDLRRLCDELLA